MQLIHSGRIHAQMENLMGLYSGEGLYTDELNSGRKTLQFAIC